MKYVLRGLTLATLLLFAVSTIAADKVVIVPLGGKKTTGDAVAADVLEGKTFSNKNEVGIIGTISIQTIDPLSTNLPAGYYEATTLDGVDNDLSSVNIKAGTSIFGVPGDSNIVNTEEGDAEPTYILKEKKAYVGGSLVTGTQGLFWGCSPGAAIWDNNKCDYQCSIDTQYAANCIGLCDALEAALINYGYKNIACDGYIGGF